MIREAIIKLSKKEDLTYQEAYECMNEIKLLIFKRLLI